MSCEYCGKDLPLIIDDRWCSELCKYAHEVYEKGEYVVDLDTSLAVRVIAFKKRSKYRVTYPKAILTSKFSRKQWRDVQYRVEVIKKRNTNLRQVTSTLEYGIRSSEKMKNFFRRETRKEREARCEKTKEAMNRFETVELCRKKSIISQNRPEVAKAKSIAVTITLNKPEMKLYLRRRASEDIAKGLRDPYSRIHGYFRTKDNERIGFSSSYELRRFLQLEEINVEFKRYHKIRISYYLNNGEHSYVPDLLRTLDNTFEEIKPVGRAKETINIAKWSAAREFCEKSGVYRFETIFEDTLFRDISYEDFLKSMLNSSLRDRIEITEEVEKRIWKNCGLELKKVA